MEKTKDVLESEKLFLEYSSGSRPNWKKLALEDRQTKINAWKKEHQKVLESRGQMAIPVNEILPSIDLIIAELTENPPRFSAMGIEKSDSALASKVAKLYDWIWYVSKGEAKIDKFSRDLIEIGLSAFLVYVDPYADNGKGEICFIDIDPIKELYLDPSSKDQDSSDSSNIIISKVLPMAKIQLMYPEINFTNIEKAGIESFTIEGADNTGQVINSINPNNQEGARLIDRYTKIKIKRYHVIDEISSYEGIFEDEDSYKKWASEEAIILTTPGQEQYVLDPVNIDKLKQVMSQYGQIIHAEINPNNIEAPPQISVGMENNSQFSIDGTTTVISLVNKQKLVDDNIIKLDFPLVDRIKRVLSVGGLEIANEILPIRDYPIITCMLHHDRTPYPMGDIRIATPLQQQLDKLSSLITTYLQNITNLKLIMQKDSASRATVETALQQAGVSVIEVDMENGDTAPFPLQYPSLPNAVFVEKQNIIRQIQRIIGSYGFQDGEVTSAPRTLGGTMQIDQMMQRRASYKQRRIEASLNQMAKVISQFIPKVYTTSKMIRIIAPNHTNISEVVFNQISMDKETQDIKLLNNITNIEFDVRVISGSMLPTNRQQDLSILTQAYQNGIMHSNLPILELLPINDVEEVIEQENQISQMSSAINQLEEKNKSLEGLIQTLQRENIQKEQKVQEMKTQTELKQLVNELKLAVSMAKGKVSNINNNKNKNNMVKA